MATPKVERLLNLVICLLWTRQYVTAEYIRKNVAGYSDEGQSDEAFNRMFERDKNELRDLGIPLVTGRSPMSGGAEGYRIDRDTYELPDISLDSEEAAAIAMAAALWDTPEVSTLSQSAILKLRAAGLDVRSEDDLGITAGGSTRSMGSEQVIAGLLNAVQDRRAVEFTHRSSATATPATRRLEPWGVVSHRGRWYVVGHDLDRQATRTFRLSRISSVKAVGRAGAVTVPEGTDLQKIVSAAVDSAAGTDGRTARIWVAAGRAAGLRRAAAASEPGELDGEAGDVLTVEIHSLSAVARMVLGAGADAVVLDPPELRDLVVAALDRLAGVSA
ncbi:proteasome accessory factor B [Gordonia paraffinivorans NBRC 108238]|uniref:Proteasome accessory factor B n=2 Tax=Gordonia paraffinivorans TaxID=175628 RepID=A0ABQ0II08_9ACTN|nr:WYL domain-containing protein [Gordonia paraffinivorans]MCD2144493.1 WYL domain-containing protein [Gordonia paraffinivorans]GAC83197.1 proteasome accessory factor B [Gordonia paraffinivorans NBRC 108238]VFA81881.1 Proteasome accessory factor B [Gordonia paraffinivorans]